MKLTVNVATHLSFIHTIIYQADWLDSNGTMFFHLQDFNGKAYLFLTAMSITKTLSDIPAGDRSIKAYALMLSSERNERGQNLGYWFTDMVNFTVSTPLKG